jgi:hypothetical protein
MNNYLVYEFEEAAFLVCESLDLDYFYCIELLDCFAGGSRIITKSLIDDMYGDVKTALTILYKYANFKDYLIL